MDAILPKVVASLKRNPCLVIEAAPGAGKTTRVPPALLGIVTGDVIVLEPRRIAARMAARRVAWEVGEAVGETIGYQVRFEEAVGPRTRLRFVTEGILPRRLLSDPLLKGVDAVVLDEFHERHLDSDLALALLKRLRLTRPELLIIVMSATLDAAPIARFLGDCPVVRSEGRLFELTVRHLPYSPDVLQVQVRRALELLVSEGHSGDVLVFLPGAAEIRKAARECEAVARRAAMLILPLHGDLSPAEQDLAVMPNERRKLILATNVAESSVTVEGVTAVIDSGLVRFATYSVWTGLPTLQVGRISKASARQRAGRAGRTGPGTVLRLYPEEDYQLRPEYDIPEIQRSELSSVGLALRVLSVTSFDGMDWLDSPAAAAVTSAETLLDSLGATGSKALQLARFPLPVRLARILLEANARGVGEAGCIVAALLGSGLRSDHGDLLAAMDAPHDHRAQQQITQLRRLVNPLKQERPYDDAVLISVLAGFPDRVARQRMGNQLLLSSGISAEIAGDVRSYEFMVAVDAEDRKESALPLVRMTARVQPEWLLDLFPERVREEHTLTWNRHAERVEARSVLLYDQLVLQESRDTDPDVEAISRLLAQKAMEAGIERFVDAQALATLEARALFAGLASPGISETLKRLCEGLQSFAELQRAAGGFLSMLEQAMDGKRLQELAPISIRLQGGRATRVHYESGRAPWIASRLQDFFGMRETPRIGRDRSPVVVHLLAPNQRAVQTTTDLAGFWERLYPQVRRELMRRYPKHAWPERP